MNEPSQEISQILHSIQTGRPEAMAELIEAAYEDLRRLASRQMAKERQNHTLTATALAHEVSAKLLDDRGLPTRNSGQFLAYAARAMRNLLIDHARSKGTKRRGGEHARVSLYDAENAQNRDRDLVELDDALSVFADVDPRKAQVVEMKFFGRMTNEEIANAIGLSVATVKRDWDVARAWLRDHMSD